MIWGREARIVVLVPSGSYDKMPQTRWLLDSRLVSPTVLEAGGLKIKVLADSVPGERLLLGL